MDYPSELLLEEGSPEYSFLKKHSGLFQTLLELNPDQSNTSIIISDDLLFGGDKTKWELFFDIFFPADAVRRVFLSRNRVDPKRGRMEDVQEIFDYLLMDTPVQMVNTLKELAGEAMNQPRQSLSHSLKQQTTAAAAIHNYRNTNTNSRWNEYGNNNTNYNYTNNNGFTLGLTEEEERMKGSLNKKIGKYITTNNLTQKGKRSSKYMKKRKNRRTRRKI